VDGDGLPEKLAAAGFGANDFERVPSTRRSSDACQNGPRRDIGRNGTT